MIFVVLCIFLILWIGGVLLAGTLWGQQRVKTEPIRHRHEKARDDSYQRARLELAARHPRRTRTTDQS